MPSRLATKVALVARASCGIGKAVVRRLGREGTVVCRASSPVRARIRRLVELQPLKRLGKSAGIAAAALFPISLHASYITGTSPIIDGGDLAEPHREPYDDA